MIPYLVPEWYTYDPLSGPYFIHNDPLSGPWMIHLWSPIWSLYDTLVIPYLVPVWHTYDPLSGPWMIHLWFPIWSLYDTLMIPYLVPEWYFMIPYLVPVWYTYNPLSGPCRIHLWSLIWSLYDTLPSAMSLSVYLGPKRVRFIKRYKSRDTLPFRNILPRLYGMPLVSISVNPPPPLYPNRFVCDFPIWLGGGCNSIIYVIMFATTLISYWAPCNWIYPGFSLSTSLSLFHFLPFFLSHPLRFISPSSRPFFSFFISNLLRFSRCILFPHNPVNKQNNLT